ncbi:unnamed protein product [Sphagnum troendelagicum]|uniref:thioredoxin-dependent peroxiredoxin n=1 Tax=Sphagnum troendelagicum TaxID=128251 RepID=A0ABP0V474_9BRYO
MLSLSETNFSFVALLTSQLFKSTLVKLASSTLFTFLTSLHGVYGSYPHVISKISVGDVVPPVGLKDQDGRLVNLDKFKGKPLVLYFYPADESPSCTKEACAFRDSYEKFKKSGAEVVGVSGDSPESHKAFKKKYRLPFTLLSDEGNKLRKDWGIPTDFFGALAGRQTYVIDKDGKVQLIFNNQFEPDKHIVETLKIIQG